MDSKTLIDRLSSQLDRDRHDVKKMLSALADVVARDCAGEDTIAVPGFGTFESRKRLERVSVHPSTGKRLLIPPKVLLTFKPSAILKNRIRN